ncbi:MAG: nucleotidyltransferase family protein [Candidatus Omnitrophota bacterium]
MRVLILAAGYGTRLYPLTKSLPKALIPINGKTCLDIIVAQVFALRRSFKISGVFVVSNNRFYKVFLNWKKKNKSDVKIINDGTNSPDDRLGAIGDISFGIKGCPSDHWLILGSDNFFDWSLNEFVQFSLDKTPHPTIGVYRLADKARAKHFGVVSVDREGRLKSFIEKPKNPRNAKIATCIYFFPKESLNYLDMFMKENKNSDASGQYIAWLVKSSSVYGYLFNGLWMDIGYKNNPDILKEVTNHVS